MKVNCQRIDAFKLRCQRRLLRVLWTAKRSNQPILKEINPEHSLEGLILKLQYSGHLMWRANSLKETLMLGKTEARRRRGRGQQRVKWLDGISNPMDMYVHACSDSATLQTVASQVPDHGILQARILEWVAISYSKGSFWLRDRPASLESPALADKAFEQTPADSEGQGRLACCSPWGCKSRTQLGDWTTTKQLKRLLNSEKDNARK